MLSSSRDSNITTERQVQYRPTVLDNLFASVAVFLPSRRFTVGLAMQRFLCLSLAAALLKIKLSHSGSSLPWFIVFSPLFASNFVAFYLDGGELYAKYCNAADERARFEPISSDSSHPLHSINSSSNVELAVPEYAQETVAAQRERERESDRLREMARLSSALLDTLGFFYLKVVLLVCLGAERFPASLTAALVPSWLCLALSLGVRLFSEYSLTPQWLAISPEGARYRPAWSVPLSLVVFLALRFLQPLLIAIQIDKDTPGGWTVAFTPLWMLAFFGIAVALLLVAFLPYLSPAESSSNHALKQSVEKFMIGLLVQIGGCSALLCWFVVSASRFLNQQQAGSDTGSAAAATTSLQLLSLVLLLVRPVDHEYAQAFQVQLAMKAGEGSYLRPPDEAVKQQNSNIADIETVNKVQWLLQTSSSTYVIADQKSLSGNNAHIINNTTSSSPGNVLQWISTPMTNMFPTHNTADVMRNKSSSGRGKSSGENMDIEMSSFSPKPSPSSDLTTGDLSSSASANYCVICLSKPADSVIQDCGHCSCCVSCLLSVAKKYPGHCPVCRAAITTVVHLKDKPFGLPDGKTVAVSNVSYIVRDPSSRRSGASAAAQDAARQERVAKTLKLMREHESLVDILM